MESFALEPHYSTSKIPGKCLKCLAEQELDNCLLQLLSGEEDNEELKHRYEMLVDFLKSPESLKLRDESEKYLSEGKKVRVKISFETGKPEYELQIN